MKDEEGYAVGDGMSHYTNGDHNNDLADSVTGLDQYQGLARKTAIFNPVFGIAYTALGLGNEAGELQGKVKKWMRDDKPNDLSEAPSFARTQEIVDELGDVLWYAAVLADQLGVRLSAVASMNIEKLRSRAQRGTLGGSGDKR